QHPSSPHFPCSSSSCNCHLCEESSTNPAFAFACAKIELQYSGYSIDAMLNLEAIYTKVRHPSWVGEEMCASIVAFLLSPTGQSLEGEDPLSIRLHGLVEEISSSSSVCPSYRLILRLLSQKPSDTICFAW
ncbi:hypothetical protein PMAYCL1PPCAC_22860, partial [Pristionchus mayeri]